MTTKQNKKPLASAPPAAERATVADDYTANARVGDPPEEQSEGIDFTDEQDQADRPDTAAIFDEEGDQES